MYIILNYIYLSIYICIEIHNRNLKNSTNDPAKTHVLLPALITQYVQPQQPLMSTKKIQKIPQVQVSPQPRRSNPCR